MNVSVLTQPLQAQIHIFIRHNVYIPNNENVNSHQQKLKITSISNSIIIPETTIKYWIKVTTVDGGTTMINTNNNDDVE